MIGGWLSMKHKKYAVILFVFALCCLSACSSDKHKEETTEQVYLNPEGNTIQERVLVPDGYTRVAENEHSFGQFLREYPLKPYGSPILLYDGREKTSQSNHEGVFQMHLEPRDLQQCADSVMRIYAEYLYRNGEEDKIRFHFVDGFECDYTHWKQGYRVVFDERGNPQWVKKAEPGSNEKILEKYLNIIFAYSSTISMQKESKMIPLKEMMIGDIFLHSGSPGHVVMVVDCCKNDAGNIQFLLAQGFMPAQEFHLIKNLAHPDNPWYDISEIKETLVTPEYRFEINEFRRLYYLHGYE